MVGEVYGKELIELDEFASLLANAGEETGFITPTPTPIRQALIMICLAGCTLISRDNETEATRKQAAKKTDIRNLGRNMVMIVTRV